MTVRVPIRRLPDARDLPLPSYATAGAAGLDLYAALEGPVTLTPGARALVSAGIQIALPDGYEAQVRARSGLALRAGLGVLNAPGTVDSDFRGTVGVLLINWGREPVTVRRGDRIAQLVVAPVAQAVWDEAGVLSETARGPGNFGSTDDIEGAGGDSTHDIG